jgi:hypothetical protein
MSHAAPRVGCEHQGEPRERAPCGSPHCVLSQWRKRLFGGYIRGVVVVPSLEHTKARSRRRTVQCDGVSIVPVAWT